MSRTALELYRVGRDRNRVDRVSRKQLRSPDGKVAGYGRDQLESRQCPSKSAGWFTEDFATSTLKESKALRSELKQLGCFASRL